MVEFTLGFLACAFLYTFWPSLAVIPSGWLRKLWDAIKRRAPKD